MTAKIILDSVSPDGKRITTFELYFHRWILAELNTHRVFSRNTASSRAIPTKKMIEMIKLDMAMPVYWGKNQPGMQAAEESDAFVDGLSREDAWKKAGLSAIKHAEAFEKAGYHKQIVNRLIEPFMKVRTLVTSTEMDNFFDLRNHPDAQPEFQVLAKEMWEVYDKSDPNFVDFHEWHLPYITDEERAFVKRYHNGDVKVLKMISVARAARVSYKTHDNNTPTFEEEITLYNRLVGSRPLHASPAEHQATPLDYYSDESLCGNFKGWQQFRKYLELDGTLVNR